jgi:uncharacterized membrane protein
MSGESVLGPVQMLVVGFEDPKFTGQILPELQRLREADVVRIIDLLVVQKDDKGEIDRYQQSDLAQDEAMEFGAIIGALIGLGTGDDENVERGAAAGAAAGADTHLIDEDTVWYVGDAIPEGSAAAIALIEHRWAIPLREKILEAGGMALADEWVHPADLVALGMIATLETPAVGT